MWPKPFILFIKNEENFSIFNFALSMVVKALLET
jgi:hypothetical protein